MSGFTTPTTSGFELLTCSFKMIIQALQRSWILEGAIIRVSMGVRPQRSLRLLLWNLSSTNRKPSGLTRTSPLNG